MRHTRDFLDNFFNENGRVRRPIHSGPGDKFAILHDKWDSEDYNAVLDEIKDLAVARNQLANAVETGGPAMGDTFHSFQKAVPHLKNHREMRPSHLLNQIVMGEVHDLKEYEELRVNTVGDIVSAAMATVAMEPKLETLFDRMENQQEMLDEMEQMAMQAMGMSEELDNIDEMMQAMMDGEMDGEMEELEAQKSRVEEALEKLKQQMESAADEVDEMIKHEIPKMKDIAREGLVEAQEQSEALDSLNSTWGLDPGMLQAMPAERRIKLAQKFNSEKFKRIAELLGAATNLAVGEQQKKVTTAKDEIYDIELGADISRVLPTELMKLGDPDLDVTFFAKLIEESLPQYKLRGTEKVAKGDIIVCVDDSGSMSGDREVWAKAVSLALLQVCKMQKRGFTGIHFGSPGEYKKYEFRTPDYSAWTFYSNPGGKAVKEPHLDPIDAVISFAETFFASGTDFHTPLSQARDKLREQFDGNGAVKGDIVFVTDGQCQVDDKWLEEFKAEQAEMGFRVWGVVIAGSPLGEPLNSICDGRVFTIKNLLDHTEIRDIFKRV